jgi:hypothetical protein
MIVLAVTLLAVTIWADSRSRADRGAAARLRNVDEFNLPVSHTLQTIFSDEAVEPVNLSSASDKRPLAPLGAALSPNNGIGVGESIALTYDDRQVFYPVGSHIGHFYNESTGDVDVHFCYEMARDTILRRQENLPLRQTGYNVYSASTPGGDWPQGGQDIGCTLQGADTIGFGRGGNMVISPNGLAVFVAYSSFFSPENPTVGFVRENKLFYQLAQYNCVYSNDPLIGNVTALDSMLYKPFWTQPDLDGNLSAFPSIATQVNGSGELVTHLVIGENANWDPPPDMIADYPVGGGTASANYRVFAYFRKVGEGISGEWSDSRILDTIERNFYDLVADPNSPNVCFAYSNPSYSGIFLNNAWDKDCYYRESTDYGVTWGSEQNITNYRNDLDTALGFGKHYSMYYECKALYTTDHNLHILFQQTPASAFPYQDGYNWTDFNQDIAHWDRTSGDYVRVADGTYMNDDALTGSINGLVCSYGTDPSTYTQFFNISECDGKIYAVWNQVHERVNHGDWQTQPELLTDCSRFVPADRYGHANWEIFMSVAKLETPYLWDQPRNLTNTFTPNCCLPGDLDPACTGPCGSEFKPYVEHYALNEAGMDLDWPVNSIVDASPGHNYAGGWYLNAEYLDDQMPGPAWDTSAGTRGVDHFNTLNSMKWIRIACVEPIEASLIETKPKSLEFPVWVKAGQSVAFPITVYNWGNVELKVHHIGKTASASWLSVSENPSPGAEFVIDAGLSNTNTFDITVDAAGILQPTWLDAYVWLLSDAADYDSLNIRLHVLAADTVEPVFWDTVMTAENMYNPFLAPYGACVGLAVGNNGELGWGGGTGGRANLDYTDAIRMDVSRRECDTTKSYTRWYLVGQTPFTLIAGASDGSGAELTQVFNDLTQADDNGFDPTPDKGSLTAGLAAGGAYDSTYTGRFVNRDTSIAMERIVYGPRSTHPATDTINFVIVYTKVYSGDGQPHNHLSFGNASDWDVPSHNYNHNVGGVSPAGFVYLKGTDTTGDTTCVVNEGRFATEAFGGGYTSVEFQANDCVNNADVWAVNAVLQPFMVDTLQHFGVPVTPAQPNPLLWWNLCAVGGLHIDPVPDTGQDYATLLTYKHDYNLAATDTLHFWTVMTTTPIGGTLAELTAQVAYAKTWYMKTVRDCEPTSCCVGRVGNANGQGEYPDEITLGDIMLLVDVKFISGDCTKLACIAECDVTQDGGANPTCEENVTLGDIMTLVDFLFITGPDVAVLKTCL